MLSGAQQGRHSPAKLSFAAHSKADRSTAGEVTRRTAMLSNAEPTVAQQAKPRIPECGHAELSRANRSVFSIAPPSAAVRREAERSRLSEAGRRIALHCGAHHGRQSTANRRTADRCVALRTLSQRATLSEALPRAAEHTVAKLAKRCIALPRLAMPRAAKRGLHGTSHSAAGLAKPSIAQPGYPQRSAAGIAAHSRAELGTAEPTTACNPAVAKPHWAAAHRSDGANLLPWEMTRHSPSPVPTGGMILLTGEGLVSGQHARGISGAPLAKTYAAQGPGNAPADEASSAAIATLANPGRDRAAVHLSRQSAVTARYSRASLSALPATATLTDRALTPGHRCPAPGVVQVWGGGLSPVSESRAR